MRIVGIFFQVSFFLYKQAIAGSGVLVIRLCFTLMTEVSVLLIPGYQWMDSLCIYKRIEIFFLFHWYKISQFDQLVFQIVCYPSGFSSGWNTNKRSVCEINIFLHLPPTHFLLFKYRDLLLEDGKESLINCRCKSGYSSTSTVYFISLHIFFVINYFE